jgi:hypothetical protein
MTGVGSMSLFICNIDQQIGEFAQYLSKLVSACVFVSLLTAFLVRELSVIPVFRKPRHCTPSRASLNPS